MDRRKQPSTRAIWALAVVVPVLLGGGAWLLADVSVPTAACATGGGTSTGTDLALVALVLVAPIAIAWRARGARPLFERIVAPTGISVLLAVPLVWLGFQVWWSGHNCYT